VKISKDGNGRDGSTKGRILFLDDNPETCEMVSIVLGQAGYEIVVGHSLTEGLRLTRSLSFDLILTDWYLPDGTGIELCRAIRESDSQTPIFFYTGLTQDEHLRSIMEAGAQGFFIKPVEMKLLLKTISSQVGAHKSLGPH
jgi:DNA-binding response OmpR family regulator